MADLRLAGALPAVAPHAAEPTGARGRPDLRRTVRRALRAGGEPINRAFVEPADAPAPPRAALRRERVDGAVRACAACASCTPRSSGAAGSRRSPSAPGSRASPASCRRAIPTPPSPPPPERVVDWSGGTRLGEGLRQFNDEWGVRGMARGAVVVILSDGWDRGDPEVLGEQMARLHRVAHRVVWVNPLKASPDFAPLARGMAAALPYVDEFVEGHSLASLEHLAEVVSRE